MKVHINYLKKLPGQTEYSSEQFYCGLEVVLPDGQRIDVQKTIASLFAEARRSVEAQVDEQAERSAIKHDGAPEPVTAWSDRRRELPSVEAPRGNGHGNGNGRNGNGDGAAGAASNKQVGFIIVLGKQRGMGFKQVQEFAAKVAGKPDLYKLSRREASAVIEQLQNA